MREHEAGSAYSLFLQLDYSRATVHRWLSGATRIPVAAVRDIVAALQDQAARQKASSTTLVLSALADQYSADAESIELQIRRELRSRGVRIEKTIEALRAANILPRTSDQQTRD